MSVKLDAIQAQQGSAIDSGIVDSANIYETIQASIGIPSGTLQIVLYLIAAGFCDVFAPMGLYIALGLWQPGRKLADNIKKGESSEELKRGAA